MKVLIFGASGLTGSTLIPLLLADASVREVVLFVRKIDSRLSSPKLKQIVVDFDKLSDYADEIRGDVVFNCLGTTLAKAGSQAAQQRIDRDYPIAIAQLAAANGVGCFVSISSVGADATSGNFYLRTKGEMEAGVAAAMGKKAYALRPSMLVGNRHEFRLGEKIGIYAMKLADPLLGGTWRKYRSMPILSLAKAALAIAKGKLPTSAAPEFDEIMALSAL